MDLYIDRWRVCATYKYINTHTHTQRHTRKNLPRIHHKPMLPDGHRQVRGGTIEGLRPPCVDTDRVALVETSGERVACFIDSDLRVCVCVCM